VFFGRKEEHEAWRIGGQVMDAYLSFRPSPKPIHKESEDDLWILFKENKMLLIKEKEKFRVPRLKDIMDFHINAQNVQYMGELYGCNCFCGEMDKKIEGENIEYLDLWTLSKKDQEIYTLAMKGSLLLNWLKLNKYCGVCGAETYIKDSFNERALVCSKCGNTTWPRTSPAIIVAVTKEDKLLLVYNRQFPERKYSVVAGFVEYGETFEECVKREVYEETGIKVKNIKYFGSQPWPFPNSMLVAFTAEYLDGEIVEDGEEIVHAGWFTKEEIEGKYDKSISIGTKLIEWFIENH